MFALSPLALSTLAKRLAVLVQFEYAISLRLGRVRASE